MAGKIKTSATANDIWLQKHFEEIVDKYGGKYPYIFITKGKVFPVNPTDDIAKIEAQITRRYGQKPLGMPLPKPEDFSAILFTK